MTISSTVRRAGPYVGNGVAQDFAFAFKVFADVDVVVTEAVVATGVETIKVLATDYTVALNADQDANPGGTVHYLVAPPATRKLVITSGVAATQLVEVTNSGGFFPAVFNLEFDKLTILVQQLDERVQRALITAVTAGASPNVPVEAGSFLRWNALGTQVEMVTLNELAGLTAANTLVDNDMLASTVRAPSKTAVKSYIDTADALKANIASPTISNPTFTGPTVLTGAAGTFRIQQWKSGALLRWQQYLDNVAEGGANAGSNFNIGRYDDAGAFLGLPLTINRATGVIGLEVDLPITEGGTGASTAAAARTNLSLEEALRSSTTLGASAAPGIALPAGYNKWRIHFIEFVPNTNNVTATMQVSYDNGATWKTTADYMYASTSMAVGSGSPYGVGSNAATGVPVMTNMSNTTGYPNGGWIDIFAHTSGNTRFHTDFNLLNSVPNVVHETVSGFIKGGFGTVTNVRLLLSAGTATTKIVVEPVRGF